MDHKHHYSLYTHSRLYWNSCSRLSSRLHLNLYSILFPSLFQNIIFQDIWIYDTSLWNNIKENNSRLYIIFNTYKFKACYITCINTLKLYSRNSHPNSCSDIKSSTKDHVEKWWITTISLSLCNNFSNKNKG